MQNMRANETHSYTPNDKYIRLCDSLFTLTTYQQSNIDLRDSNRQTKGRWNFALIISDGPSPMECLLMSGIRIHFIFLATIFIALHYAANSMDLSLLKFSCGLRKTILFLQERCFGRSRSSKVDDFGANWKRICDFLLVCHSNLGPILHRFGDFLASMCSTWPHPYSTLIFGCSHCTRSPMLGSASAWALSYSAVILFLKNSKRCENIPQRHRQTDGQMTCNLITALCVASHGKNS